MSDTSKTPAETPSASTPPAPPTNTPPAPPAAKVSTAPAAFVFDEERCMKHLYAVVDSQEKYKGMKEHNPYIFLEKVVNPLVRRLKGVDATGRSTEAGPERTKDLQDEILRLPVNFAPRVIPKNEGAEAEQEQTTMVLTASGFKAVSNKELAAAQTRQFLKPS